MLHDPRRRVRPARRHEPRRPEGRGQRADVHRHERRRTSRRAATTAARTARTTTSRRRVKGTFVVPCYLDAAGLRAGRAFNYSARDGLPMQLPATTSSAHVRLQHPAARPTATHRRAAVALRPRPARQRRRGRRRQRRRRWPTSTTSCSARPTGSACRDEDIRERRRHPRRPLELPDAGRPRASRACSTSCSSGRR